MSLRQTYRLWAPIYDLMLKQATRAARSRNLEELGAMEGKALAIIGIGSGLDLDLFNERTRPEYCVGLDITRAMLKRAQARGDASSFPVRLIEADAMNTPLKSQQFDVVLLHLILAVVPKPERALAEASRILKPGGRIVIFDKFLHHHQKAPLRRLISPLLGMLATRTDVELEPLLAAHPELRLTRDESLLARGWFRGITLIKNA
ncbi:class I SAM-dependent methyltransferase [Halothiobacillus neapolitanus]|uniref:Methyltransferase type 11 n=1 Tax=Halothiobacillus neapolitanus (strain ATCC 23641 / DSM 15147 / CIP 104769 / NCIMB 8539 / c2) TaxID=555778 RepID=D0L093_HALNC|nr:class I SAM-dependent methyltransferase [Halothiobacillus neapolitanus]ACX96116.1 Methyltransferase type 11 [Halothiobacillus neapolitanus c2]TDN66423.1 methyltransferase family protein [Halothiobacillus neapolitanus]